MLKELAAILCAACLVAGCTNNDKAPTPAPSKFPNWPNELNGMRFRWTTDPGIELLTGPAVPLRAYLESYRIGYMTRSIDTTYPGFQRAVPNTPPMTDSAWADLPEQLQFIRPTTDPHDYNYFGTGPFFGNEYFHIQELSEIPGGYRAYVCDGYYNLFQPAPDWRDKPGKYTAVADIMGAPQSTISLWRVEFSRHGDDNLDAAPEKGQNPAPAGDVFGTWNIDGASNSRRGGWGKANKDTSETIARDLYERVQRCSDAQPYTVEQRTKLSQRILDAPPEAEPAVPGWPSDSR